MDLSRFARSFACCLTFANCTVSDQNLEVGSDFFWGGCSPGTASGWDVGECFQAARPKVPVLYTSAQVIELERHVPDDVFIAKPYQHNDILNTCQRLLSK